MPLAARFSAARAAGPDVALLLAMFAAAAAGSAGRAWLLALAALWLACAWRGARRTACLLVAAALLAQAGGEARARFGARSRASQDQLLAQRLDTVRARFAADAAELGEAVRAITASRHVAPALAGEVGARARLFAELEALRAGRSIELAVQTPGLEPVAWAGRPADLAGYHDVVGRRGELLVLEGALSTSLLAVRPVNGTGRGVAAVVTAERVLASRRNLRNRFVREFDRLLDGVAGVQAQYYDVRDDPRTAHAFGAAPSGTAMRDAALVAPDGRTLAVVRASSVPGEAAAAAPVAGSRIVSLLLVLALVAWGYVGRDPLGAHAVTATAVLRVVTILLPPPFPGATSPLLSPDTYASLLLGPLSRSPLDLLATSAGLAHVGAALVARWSRRPVPRPSLARLLLCGLAAPALVAAPFAWIADTAANTSLDIETLTLVPKTGSHLVLQTALLLVLALGTAALGSLMSWGGPPPATRGARFALGAGWLAIAAAAYALWPRQHLGLPLVPALVLFALGSAAGMTRARWQAALARATTERRAVLFVAGVGCGALLLYPSLVHFGEKETRHRIARDEAALILRQPQWRDYVLEQTCRRIDGLGLLDGAYATQHPLGAEQLAFAVWSATDLAAFGFSSAVEVQDARGGLLSRFALNLPSLETPAASPPESERWVVDRERLRVGSSERAVLHARRTLAQDGLARGGVHVYLADDFWNLPFLPARDAWGALYRPDLPPGAGGRDVVLLVYDRAHVVQFSSAERPPALTAELVARLRATPGGFWTTLPLDGRPFHTFLFSDAQGTYALAYARRPPERFAAELLEALLAFVLLALAALFTLMLVRTLLRRRTLSLPALAEGVRRRFRLRLFAAFVAVAIAPVAVMQWVVQGVVRERLRREAEDQALERASVAQKAVEDFAAYQRRADGAAPEVTDAALVWIASLIRNDLDVFADGRLLASSKRELYASGLLPTRLPGPVFRELALEGHARALSTEHLGAFTTRVVSVPVRLGDGVTGILRVPLALRERELQTVLADVDRLVRVASMLFLLLAAVLAQSLARRIAGPLRDLTDATRRVARGDLTARVTTASRDEFRGLVEAFNQMAADLGRQRRDLERSNRLAAWAEMARQVAHEVKNPLTPIQLSAEHLRRVWRDPQTDFGAALETCTQTILRQVRTLRDIVTEFSAFARPPVDAPVEVDLAAVLRDVVEPYRAALPPGVTLSVDVDERLETPVRGERRLLARALVNLVENALQALEGHGHVALRLRADAPAQRVVVEVEDSGPGVDPELGERIFEPFFSTKTSGSGLGLALVRKIAEEHGGGVTLESRPGRTCATLWLPATEPRATLSAGRPPTDS